MELFFMDVISQLAYFLETAHASRTELLLGCSHCCHVSHLRAGSLFLGCSGQADPWAPLSSCRAGMWLTGGVTGCESDPTLVKKLWLNTKWNTWTPSAVNILRWSLGLTDIGHYAQGQELTLEIVMDSDGDFRLLTSQRLIGLPAS